jgi:hypothetical protein
MKAMGNNVLFEVRFEVVKVAPPGSSSAYQYRRGMRKALVQAARVQDLPSVLNADITLQPGESIDILGALEVSSTVLG